MRKRILIVEDEKDISKLLEFYFNKEGYDVESVQNGELGLLKLAQERFDLLILDLLLPKLDGWEVCRIVRSQSQTADLPTIMLTAKNEQNDRLRGLELGADFYITKPFSPREVVARVKALLRRAEKKKGEETRYLYEGITLDADRYEASFKGNAQVLTVKEFNLLKFLLANEGRMLTRDELLNAVWGYDYFGTTRTLDVHVAWLRRKFHILERNLISVRGMGYKLLERSKKR